jgi:hypothetical protein
MDGQKHNSTMVSDASPGTATPKMNTSFIHMAHVSSNHACAQDGYLTHPHPTTIDGDMRLDSGWTHKEVTLAELSKILKAALSKAQAELSPIEFFKYNFSTEPDVSKDLPDMTLQLQHAKLQGVDTSAFNKLKFYAQMACRSWHLEVASRYAPKMKLLVQYAKEASFVAQYCGVVLTT